MKKLIVLIAILVIPFPASALSPKRICGRMEILAKNRANEIVERKAQGNTAIEVNCKKRDVVFNEPVSFPSNQADSQWKQNKRDSTHNDFCRAGSLTLMAINHGWHLAKRVGYSDGKIEDYIAECTL